MRSYLILSACVVVALMLASPGMAETITFSDVTDGQVVTSGYTGGSTNEVAVSYAGDLRGYVSPWYPGDLGGCVYNANADGIGTIMLAGQFFNGNQYQVTVSGIDLRLSTGTATTGALDYSTDLGANWASVSLSLTAGAVNTVALDVTGQNVWLRFSDMPSGESIECDAGLDNIVYGASIVPEPSTMTLLAAALFGLLCYAWRKRK